MAKVYSTIEEGMNDIMKHTKNIINAFDKNKYSKLADYVSKNEDGSYTIKCCGNYKDYKYLVNGTEVKMTLPWWNEWVTVGSSNIGALRGDVDALNNTVKAMRTNFEYVYF